MEAIALEAHKKGIPLIVDEAHGAHFGFHPYFPENSNTKGADIVIHSVHKTLPSLTQTALLHINGELVDRRRVRKYLHMLQTSSPSYVLMASIDSCMDLLENRGKELFDAYAALLEDTREKLKGLKWLKLIETEHFDRSKIVISVKNTDITGRSLYKALLKDYHLQMEMAAGTYVLAMTSVADVEEGMERLVRALFEIERKIGSRMERLTADGVSETCGGKACGGEVCSRKVRDMPSGGMLPRLEMIYSSAEAADLADRADNTPEGVKRSVPWEESEGGIALEYAYLYPPGGPLIVPGEKITKEAADMLQWYHDKGYAVEGPEKDRYIDIWIQE